MRKLPNGEFDRLAESITQLESASRVRYNSRIKSTHLCPPLKHLGNDAHTKLTIELISEEALQTSAIEGEFLDRESLQSSIRKQLGLQVDAKRKIPGAERGVAELMVDVNTDFDAPLSHQSFFKWHKSLLNARKDLNEMGCFSYPHRYINH